MMMQMITTGFLGVGGGDVPFVRLYAENFA